MLPKYRRIAEELRIHIQSGKYRNAKILPPEFALAEEYQVSRQTVRQALALLADMGLIERRQGSGSYIRHAETVPEPASSAARRVAVVTSYISDYIFPSILREANAVFFQSGCAPTLYATQNHVATERAILTSLLSSHVDGILVEGTKTALPNPNLDLYKKLYGAGVPLVFMNGCYAQLSGALFVMDDNYGGGRMLVEHLYRKGHRNIAGIFKSDDIQGHYRYSGYMDALRDLGLDMDDRRVFWYNTEVKSLLAEDSFMPMLEQTLDGCTAVVCYNDEIALHLVRKLLQKGVDVPGDMAVVSFDNSQYSKLSPLQISSLSHEASNVGRLSAELLIRLMDGEDCHSQLVPWTLIERDSG